MKTSPLLEHLLRAVVPAALALLLAFPQDIFAQPAPQDHLVSPQMLQQRMENADGARQQNIQTILHLLGTSVAQRAMQEAHVDPVQVRIAVPTLSDQELASLANRAADAQQKIDAGVLGFGVVTLLVIAIIILIVVAVVR